MASAPEQPKSVRVFVRVRPSVPREYTFEQAVEVPGVSSGSEPSTYTQRQHDYTMLTPLEAVQHTSRLEPQLLLGS